MEETVEVVEPVVEQPQPDASGLAAGFNKVRGIETPVIAEKPEEVKAEPVVEVVETPPAAVIPDFEQFKGQTAQEMQKLHGKIGEFNRTLQQLQAQPTAANSEAHKAAIARFTEEWPELATAILPLVNPVSVSEDQISAIVQKQVSQATEQTNQQLQALNAKYLLTKSHPDWEEIPKTPEYSTWLKAKPLDFQKSFLESWDPSVVSSGLTDFKTWKATTYKTSQAKQSRLAGAVTPTGVPSRGQSLIPDKAGLAAGFNRVRRIA